MDLDDLQALTERVKEEVRKTVVGQDEVIELLLVAKLAEGHILLEGVPGTAKTLVVRSFAAALSMEFGRIQFTPDLMPGDVLGTNLFNFQTNQFRLVKGPVFTQILLADEINRTPPKTQAALLEAMHERAVTIDGQTHPLIGGLMVLATQNPIEQQGTYPLPEAQLDRFLFKHLMGYPSREEELAIVARHGHRSTMPRIEDFGVEAVAGLGEIEEARALIAKLLLSEDNMVYLVDLIRATREHPSIAFGASPRSANMLASAARALAALRGRDFVIPDDIKFLALPTLRHRIVLSPAAEIEGVTADQVMCQIIEQVAAPR